MDWQKLVTDIIIAVAGLVISTLGTYLIAWVNTKIKDEKLKKVLAGAVNIVSNGVDYVYQIYVEGLKGTDAWDKEAMEKANQMAIDYIVNNLSKEAIEYITASGKTVLDWAKEQIEIAIKKSKDNATTTIAKEVK